MPLRPVVLRASLIAVSVLSVPELQRTTIAIPAGAGPAAAASPPPPRNCKQKPVWILGAGEAVAHQGAGKRDLMYIAAKQSHVPAFEMAQVTQKDIDMAMVYDSFTITVLETLEDLGFCEKGEGGQFVLNLSLIHI